MLAGALISLASSLVVIILGTTLLTFAFYGGHSVASGWVSIRAKTAKSQAASFYLFTYYTGSSLLGYFGGFAWQHGRWPGITTLIGITLTIALAISIALMFTARNHTRSSIPSNPGNSAR
jgi:YNFM family putative membrane transporter